MTAMISRGELVQFAPFSSLRDLLQLEVPPLSPSCTFQQLEQVEQYAKSLGCVSVVIEQRYIDRDYMEDHSVFYSRNFDPRPNSCRRVSFFSTSEEDLRVRIQSVFERVAEARCEDRAQKYRALCRSLSREVFLGFMVVRPLPATPVGRTALRHPAQTTADSFPSAVKCTAHLLGVEFEVTALPFQQQDVGVSACATTAVWSSLQKLRQFEEIGSATPVEITTMANQFGLPFGRPMPSEGLATDQMCQVIRAVGASPVLLRLSGDFDSARAAIYSATRSGFAPIMILRDSGAIPIGHAVTITGMQLGNAHEESTDDVCEDALRLTAIYVHDDRFAPYHLVTLNPDGKIQLPRGCHDDRDREWIATHLLVAMHNKIRLSLSGLHVIGRQLKQVLSAAVLKDTSLILPSLAMSCWISKAPDYMTSFVIGERCLTPQSMMQLNGLLRLPRYVGVIRFASNAGQLYDVLVDTTSTDRNLNILAVISVGATRTDNVALHLSRAVGVPMVLSLAWRR